MAWPVTIWYLTDNRQEKHKIKATLSTRFASRWRGPVGDKSPHLGAMWTVFGYQWPVINVFVTLNLLTLPLKGSIRVDDRSTVVISPTFNKCTGPWSQTLCATYSCSSPTDILWHYICQACCELSWLRIKFPQHSATITCWFSFQYFGRKWSTISHNCRVMLGLSSDNRRHSSESLLD